MPTDWVAINAEFSAERGMIQNEGEPMLGAAIMW